MTKLISKCLLNTDELDQMFQLFATSKPTPKIELDYMNPYTLLVAVILSAQATDKGVNKVTPALFAVADTPDKMVKLGEENLKQYIKTIGLYNNKARNIILMSAQLMAQFQGQVPEDFTALCTLPGVGRKSANVVMNSAFGHPTIGVDTHVFRVSNRIGLCQTKTPEQTEAELLKIIPVQWRQYAHHWLVLHGRYVCKARTPSCGNCIISHLCKYDKKNLAVTPHIEPGTKALITKINASKARKRNEATP